MGRDDGVKMSQEKGVGASGLGRTAGAHVAERHRRAGRAVKNPAAPGYGMIDPK
jgi:hypothetical protein